MNFISNFRKIDLKKHLNFDVFFSLLIFTFPFANAYMYPFLALSFITFIREKKYLNIQFLNNKPLLIYIVFVLFLYLQGLFHLTLIEDFKLNSKLFIIFFLLIFTLSYKWKKNGGIGEKAFVFGVAMSILISVINMTSYWFKYGEVILTQGSEVNDILNIRRPYLGIFIVTSIFISLKNISLKIWNKKYYWLVLSQFIFLAIISARLSTLLAVIVVFVHFLILFKKNKTNLALFIIASVGMLALLVFNPILQKRFKIDEGFKIDLERTLDHEPRYLIYSCSLGFLSEGIPFFGYSGNNELQAKLNNCYASNIEKKEKREYYLRAQFHTHNAFLNFTFLGGWVSLILFILLFIYPILSSQYSIEAKFMLVIFGCFFFFENVLHTNHGSIFFGVFYMYYLGNQRKIDQPTKRTELN